ncbi:ssDNA endonuclease and repair protein rad10 [Malassezia vespertilionis]|uniref:Rad10p n=1 Tax=Malassezia vespertilionis TaxID=2020962 RepID=A0A2N1JAD8_9BASI|nr:ssDNA endonuclease and repair protein rad10 [Malassezia vespertilionis]PKI83518.1 Rad10p [Malassezia vespertilionis]WFD07246.1 ssDNA endonuclease and repair protein rad10 [Malassezia vespertilionis]
MEDTGETGTDRQRARPHPLIRGAQTSSASILVNSCQRGNPILQHIKGVPWEYADIVPDYQVGVSNGVLFLSLRYHRLHPEYIHTRIQRLARMYTLRVLLILCDVVRPSEALTQTDHQAAIKELTRIALVNRMVIIVAWSPEEAGRYLEVYKAFEQTPPDTIRARVQDSYMSQLTATLTNVRGINKTDVMTLASHVGSLEQITDAPPEKLMMLPGLGDVKVQNLQRAFQQPFRADGLKGAPPKETPAPPQDTTFSMDNLPPNFESLPEEEQLRIAMELSIEGM